MRLTLNKVAGIVFVIAITLGIWFLYSSGYRFSSLGAAKAHFNAEKSVTDFGEVNFQWGKVYLFRTSKGPRTVLAIKEGFLWRAPVTVHFPQNSDNIKTVGWMSYTGKDPATVFAVETSDPTISYIEVGPTTERIKKEITVNSPVIFSWDKPVDFNTFNPVALSKEGNVLFEYRYPKNTTTISSDDLKWYPFSGSN
ncbi:hypothetical protein [Desulfosporosinus meridiei]|uniref:Uncharacterized protein n=1 Tax=Desulfosporosinus meridiei (strain ATCC BAA-275 / DSM 13257 / KCTC 12902 / NCIMB 13706 / S10) TaxID=768704 RepID=J7J081_DESMD|nr:hypothetical protein [Desulfosporosinus meridiei]AFQ44346.1 hypothetical protein Desmer_2425 [Desulfosporosinus meridiei DSM 13257]